MSLSTLKHAVKSSNMLSKVQALWETLKYDGAYLKTTAHLRVAHVFEIDRGFETPIGLPLTMRHHGGFSQELAWALKTVAKLL